MKHIPVAGPWITDAEVARVAEATRCAWYEDANGPTADFEEAFARKVGRAFAVSLPSCTSALHLVLAALGVGEDDEVIVPDATWIATAAPISYVGAQPVFVDVDPTTWCLAPDAVRRAIGPRTRAVIAVDLYGGMPEFDALQDLCSHAGVALIEDAAEAIGSMFHGEPAGSFGVASTFSFHGSKTLTTGEGGMLVTNDRELLERAQVLRDHGRAPGDVAFFNREVAFKYKMSAMQAALGHAQLDRLDQLVARKRAIFGWYRDRLASRPELTLNAEPPGTFNSYWMTTVIIDDSVGLTKAEVSRSLTEVGISTRPFFHPLSRIPAYSDHPRAHMAATDNHVSTRLGTYGLNLPSALILTEDDVDHVCTELLRVIDAAR